MRITHLCLGCFYSDGFSYQENMLPKYHKILGHEVKIIASLQIYDKNGHLTYWNGPLEYLNEHNIPVQRLVYKTPVRINQKLKRYVGTYRAIEKSNPEILFVHGCQFMDVDVVVKYAKNNPDVRIYVDNHADFKNSAKNIFSRLIMHRILWRIEANRLLPYTQKYYGVLPARVDFLERVYKIPNEKVELLCIGADDEFVEKYSSREQREKTRERNGFSSSDLVIITGGKINSNRPETLELMKAVAEYENPNVKLLVYGVVDSAYKEQFDELCNDPKITFIGWLTPEQTYENIASSDLVAFPGLHSVMWEQAVAQGIPCLFRSIPGFNHVDIGGNAYFCEDVSKNGLSIAIKRIFGDMMNYAILNEAASSKERKRFLYSEIAKKCIDQ